jgi:cytochrome c oxidase cbb3-type subunit 2
MSGHQGFFHNLDKSALLTVIGILLLFSMSVAVVLVAPKFVDPSWTQPTTPYQVQMYEVSDPNFYISAAGANAGTSERQCVYHLKQDFSLLAFQESELMRIVASPELEMYITHQGDSQLKLTSRLLMIRIPEAAMQAPASALRAELQKNWEARNPQVKTEGRSEIELLQTRPSYSVMELYDPKTTEAFALAPLDTIIENWVDSNFTILDATTKQPYHKDSGVIFVKNPQEYRFSYYKLTNEEGWRYNPKGQPITSLQELKNHRLGFHSRQELIKAGEQTYNIEGCWYCHTDQTRTIVQDVVLNGSDSYPAPPSSANEYIYQRITFPGTRRIGPDMSRVAIKRPSRDWHRGHFWSPKIASKGSIMPSFRHFFDDDPRGASNITPGVPNFTFEAIFQYLMTKGTRITPPTQAWWLGKDPVNTLEIIEGRKKQKQKASLQ